jgi:oligoribonuclease
MIDKTIVPTKLLWVDLEMTGLNPQRDLIVEIAVIITDFNFKTLATYEARIKHDEQKLTELFNANLWYRDNFPDNQQNFLKNLDSAKTSEIVEQELIGLVDQHFGKESAILAGNSIHADRGFIRQYWPILDSTLHYRMMDVSAWKIIMNSKFNVEYEKESPHRALGDIEASIAELKFYLDWFSKNKASNE